MERRKPFNDQDGERNRIINEQIIFAQESGKRNGFEIGQTVAHPSDDFAYALKEINGDQAVVWFGPGREDTIKIFPLNELFDPNLLKKRSIIKDASKRQEN